MCSIRGEFPSWVAEKVYNNLAADAKLSKGQDMWQKRTWNGMAIYGSSYWWKV